MHIRLVAYLVLASLLGGTFWYVQSAHVCPVPFTYRIGTIDEGFAITEAAALEALTAAETAWEAPTGRDLFQYDPNADFTVNFIFDDRQAMADDEAARSAALDAERQENIAFFEGIEELEETYRSLSDAYNQQVAAYDERLAGYNRTVQRYNDQGGAPPAEFERLQETQRALDEEAGALQLRADELNNLANRINALGAEGNQLIQAYNRQVQAFNRDFGYSREFTQGDFRGDRINIYKFSSDAELITVLAHEFGHALGIDHVDDDTALMYYLLTDASETPTLSASDLAVFEQACSAEETPGQRLRQLIRQTISFI